MKYKFTQKEIKIYFFIFLPIFIIVELFKNIYFLSIGIYRKNYTFFEKVIEYYNDVKTNKKQFNKSEFIRIIFYDSIINPIIKSIIVIIIGIGFEIDNFSYFDFKNNKNYPNWFCCFIILSCLLKFPLLCIFVIISELIENGKN